MTKVNESLAFLNFGQQLIFTTGLSLALLHTASLVASGAAPVGQIILVSTLLLQVRRKLSKQPKQHCGAPLQVLRHKFWAAQFSHSIQQLEQH